MSEIFLNEDQIFLNEDQKAAVQYFGKKPLLIEAGPGSGKTEVIIERVKFLINEKDIDPESLLIITFTKKATKELIDRLINSKNGLDKEIVSKMQISTIHSFCHRLLSDYGISYSVLNGEESNNMFVYKNLKKLGFVEEKSFKKRHIPQLVNKFNELTSFKVDIDKFEKYVYDNFPVGEEYLDFIKEVLANDENEYFTFPEKEVKDGDFKDDWYNARYQHVCESYRKYLKLLEDENLIDYALLQTKVLELFENSPKLIGELKYKNILIDEFQDTDPVQMKIFEILMKNVETFTVVGDDEQSIYAFRGSSVRFFKEFEEKYNAKVIVLRTNYRSTESIVKFNENFIKQDRDPNSTKSIHAEPNHEGPEKSMYHLYNLNKDDEAFNVVKLIKFLKESGRISNYSDVGILTRVMGMKISPLLKNLKYENISYNVVGNKDLIEKDEIKSILLLFYYLIENDEKPYIMNKWEVKWLNISGFASESFNMINLSEQTRNILLELENKYKNKVIEVEKEVYEELIGKKSRKRTFKGIFDRDEEILIEIFNRVEKPFLWKYNTKDLRKLGISDDDDLEFFDRLYNLRKELDEERKNENIKYENVSTLLNVFYRLLDITGYLNIEFVEDEKNTEELGNLGILSHTLYNLENVITRTNLRVMFWYLYHNIENYDSNRTYQSDEVQIMTIHKSKGLEFPVTIVYGLQKDSFPSKFRDDENKLTGLMGVPLFPVPNEFAEYKKSLSLEEKEKHDYLEERRVLYVAMTRAEDILVLSTRLDRNGNMPKIEGIDFNPISIPEITNDFSILPKTHFKHIKKDEELLPLSFTSLESYKNCPFKYYLKYNLFFAESDNIYMKKGNFVHKFLNRIHRRAKDEKINFDEMLTQHTVEVDRIKNKKEIENLQKYLKNSFKDIEVLESELPFRIEEGEFVLEGIIDLIYKKDGKIGIMDFKTTSKVDEEESKRQLFIYLIALKESRDYSYKIEELAIYLVNSQKILTYKIDEEYLKNLQTNIHEIFEDINNNKFYRKHGTHCNKCTFNFICGNKKAKKPNTIHEVNSNEENKNEVNSNDIKKMKKRKLGVNEQIIDKPIPPLKNNNENTDTVSSQDKESVDVDKIESEASKIEAEINRIKKEDYLESKSLKTYEKQIHELESLYYTKEKVAREVIKKRFSPPQMTYDRFIEMIESSNQIFHKHSKSALNIIEVAKLNTPLMANLKRDEELKKTLNTLKSLVKRIDNLINELALSLGNSTKDSYSNEAKDLLDDMQKLIDSIKEYK
ncbi:MAG: UvrD-helicase domain-containing protein [Methanobrevibacter sp.]|jgi:DNA helicase-2/ATP-dependent DNA helicase PcrA|nr:UvrD-helicase domain-containing protein [Candidatus Methanovirga meridionalis]